MNQHQAHQLCQVYDAAYVEWQRALQECLKARPRGQAYSHAYHDCLFRLGAAEVALFDATEACNDAAEAIALAALHRFAEKEEAARCQKN